MIILICLTLIIIVSIICFTVYKLRHNDAVERDIDDIKFRVSQIAIEVQWLQKSNDRTFKYLTELPLVKKEDQFKVTCQND